MMIDSAGAKFVLAVLLAVVVACILGVTFG